MCFNVQSKAAAIKRVADYQASASEMFGLSNPLTAHSFCCRFSFFFFIFFALFNTICWSEWVIGAAIAVCQFWFMFTFTDIFDRFFLYSFIVIAFFVVVVVYIFFYFKFKMIARNGAVLRFVSMFHRLLLKRYAVFISILCSLASLFLSFYDTLYKMNECFLHSYFAGILV